VLNYYVYYRVNPRYDAEAAAAAKQMLFEIEAETGIQGRVLQKRGEPQLWMEIYENVAAGDAFESLLAKAELRMGFQRFLQEGSTRKMECFQG
jgi:hypothetical protein